MKPICSITNSLTYWIVLSVNLVFLLFALIPLKWLLKNGFQPLPFLFFCLLILFVLISLWVLWLNGAARSICVDNDYIRVKVIGRKERVYSLKEIKEFSTQDVTEEEGWKAEQLRIKFNDGKIIIISSTDYLNFKELKTALTLKS